MYFVGLLIVPTCQAQIPTAQSSLKWIPATLFTINVKWKLSDKIENLNKKDNKNDDYLQQ